MKLWECGFCKLIFLNYSDYRVSKEIYADKGNVFVNWYVEKSLDRVAHLKNFVQIMNEIDSKVILRIIRQE